MLYPQQVTDRGFQLYFSNVSLGYKGEDSIT